jgi:hypothetical protein
MVKLDKQSAAWVLALVGAIAAGGELRSAVGDLQKTVTDVRERVARIEATLEAAQRHATNHVEPK